MLLPDDDAATANWGNIWRMPTKEEWQELEYHCTSVLTHQNGVYGVRFTGSNGNSLFLPASGCRCIDELVNDGYLGYYWVNSLYTDAPDAAWLFFDDLGALERFYGLSVRAVRSPR